MIAARVLLVVRRLLRVVLVDEDVADTPPNESDADRRFLLRELCAVVGGMLKNAVTGESNLRRTSAGVNNSRLERDTRKACECSKYSAPDC